MLDNALAALRLFLVTIVLCAISYPLILLGPAKPSSTIRPREASSR